MATLNSILLSGKLNHWALKYLKPKVTQVGCEHMVSFQKPNHEHHAILCLYWTPKRLSVTTLMCCPSSCAFLPEVLSFVSENETMDCKTEVHLLQPISRELLLEARGSFISTLIWALACELRSSIVTVIFLMATQTAGSSQNLSSFVPQDHS